MKKFFIAMTTIVLLASFVSRPEMHKDIIASKYDTTKPRHADTTIIMAAWSFNGKVLIDSVPMITKDTFDIVKIDTVGNKLIATRAWKKDSTIYLPFVTDTVKKTVSWFGAKPPYVQEIKIKPIGKK
jgi:hypothetical protein